MVWVLACERHYTDGTTTKLYHKGITMGLFHDCVGKPSEAKQYKTKKEALADRRIIGLNSKWIPERVA